MKKAIIIVLIAVSMSLPIATNCLAEPGTNRLGMGWQLSRPATGFTLKIPVVTNFYLQPVLAFSMVKKPDSTKGHFSIGLRAMGNLPNRGNFQPYAGVSLGHSEDFNGTSVTNTVVTNGGTGYEAFIGIEYQKYAFRPALEFGLGGFARSDGSYYAGAIVNLAMFYYF